MSGGTGDAHDIDGECGYPQNITFQMYKVMYQREGIATRVVSAFPQECWSVWPWIYETDSVEEDEQTKFELKWKEICEKHGLYSTLAQFDETSGVGQYAVLLQGFDDGRPLDQIAPGIDENGDMIEGEFEEREILYLRVFDQGEAPVKDWNSDFRSKRYGLPQMYSITMVDPANLQLGANPPGKSIDVHWSRVIHLPSDGRASTSKVFGPPRQENVFNYLLNCRKILGGSPEMLWKGGYPLTVFEVPPEIASEVELDKESIAREVEEAFEGLKRHMSLQGVLAKQLMPNIADPDSHLDIQLLAISIAIGIPQRILMGTEEARLASLQDSTSWNKKVHRRHGTRCNPDILRPLVDRWLAVRVLPMPADGKYFIEWPDLYSISETEKADITGKLVKALSEYVTSGASRIFPPLQFLTMIMDFTPTEAEEIIEAAMDAVEDEDIQSIIGPTEEEIQQQEAELDATKSQSEKNRNFGKPKESPATRQYKTNSFVVNPLMRCSTGGKPGFKYGEGGKCYPYNPGDKASIKRARRKARTQGVAIEASKKLQSMEEQDKE